MPTNLKDDWDPSLQTVIVQIPTTYQAALLVMPDHFHFLPQLCLRDSKFTRRELVEWNPCFFHLPFCFQIINHGLLNNISKKVLAIQIDRKQQLFTVRLSNQLIFSLFLLYY